MPPPPCVAAFFRQLNNLLLAKLRSHAYEAGLVISTLFCAVAYYLLVLASAGLRPSIRSAFL